MRIIVIIVSICFLVFLDLSSKIFVEDTVFGSWKDICSYPEANSAATVEYCDRNTMSFGELFSIQLSYNEGIAFSLPLRGLLLQILTGILVLGIISFFIIDEYPKSSRLLDTGYVCIIAGALSHAYERIFIGRVVDFISVKYFAIFNFADIFISIGAFLLILYYVLLHRKHR